MKPKAPKPPRAKIPATVGARKLLKKLEALATCPGTPDEGKAAAKKLDRLKAKYDFTAADVPKEYLFAGTFQPSSTAFPVIRLDDWALISPIKWAIEQSTGIRCVLRGSELLAQATPRTTEKLSGIAKTISEGFGALWGQFRRFPDTQEADRNLFVRGLFDGMMDDLKPAGEPLPQRSTHKVISRAKRQAVGRVAGIGLHPYSVAVDLGKQIRFNVPLPDISNQLEQMAPRQIAA